MKKLNEKLRAKLSKSGGFTLVEMLIVVAIIAILIAVSIPMVNSALEKSREAVDAANERNARAVATITFMTASKTKDDADNATGIGTDGGKAYYSVGSGTGATADTTTGTLVKEKSSVNGDGYGQGTKSGDVKEDHKGMIIEVEVTAPSDTNPDPQISIKWVSKTAP